MVNKAKLLKTDRTKVSDFIKLLRKCNPNKHISLEWHDGTITDELLLSEDKGSLIIQPYKSGDK